MIRRIVLSALVLAGAFLAGCASGPKFSEVSSSILPIPAAEGRIYFFRSSSMMGAALQPDIRLDGEVVGSSKPGGFFYVDRPAGSHTAAAATETEKTITFDLAAGETKYLRTSPSFGVIVGHIAFEIEEPGKAMAEIQTLSLTGSLIRGASVQPSTATTAATRAAAATTAPDPGAASVDRPAHARHLDAAMLEGRSWIFAHPRDPGRYGNVHIRFANGIATASNSRSSSSGPFHVANDRVCIDFQTHDWARACYYVVDSDPAGNGASRPMVWTAGTHVGVPVTIE